MAVGDKMFDVVAVSIDDSKVLWVMGPYDEPNAEAVIKMAVFRQGCEDRFFASVAACKYDKGDTYAGDGKPIGGE